MVSICFYVFVCLKSFVVGWELMLCFVGGVERDLVILEEVIVKVV